MSEPIEKALIEQYGARLVGHSLSVWDIRTYSAPENAVLARFQYTYSDSVRKGKILPYPARICVYEHVHCSR